MRYIGKRQISVTIEPTKHAVLSLEPVTGPEVPASWERTSFDTAFAPRHTTAIALLTALVSG
jgi:hypothetical protein